MKAQGKYVQLLENELEAYKTLLGQARKDIEFYRGKVERLELSLREAGVPVAAPELPRKSLADTVSQLKKLPSGKLPFSEIKRRWNMMSQEEQEKAVDEGNWDIDAELKKEETNAGSG